MRGYRDSKAYFEKLIELMGKGGGFIIDAASVISEGKTGNVKAWFEFTRERGAHYLRKQFFLALEILVMREVKPSATKGV